MYVCMCYAVTDREIEAEIAAGARDEDEIGDATGAGTGCGMCVNKICAILQRSCPSHGVVAPALSA